MLNRGKAGTETPGGMGLDLFPVLRADLFRIYEGVFPAMRVGATPSEVVDEDRESGIRLLHYKCDRGQNERIILFIPHIINRPYILDLHEDVSVVQTFCRHGFNVYLVDWGYPRGRNTGFADYVGYVDRCVRLLTKGRGVSIMGYCTGGIVSLIYASLHVDRVKNMILLATPTDFSSQSDLRVLAGKMVDARYVAALCGNVPGELFNLTGAALLALCAPVFMASQEFIAEFLTYEAWRDAWRRYRWIVDTPPVPASAYVEFIEGCYKENRLIRGKLEIGNQVVELSRIRCPVLNILAKYDHLVPLESGRGIKKAYSGTSYQEIVFPSSHVGLSISRKAHRELWPHVSSWLEAKSTNPTLPGKSMAQSTTAGGPNTLGP